MLNKSLNILIVASWFPDEKQPTNGSFIEEQVQMLVASGHRVTVLHPYLTGTFSKTVFKKDTHFKESRKGVEVVRVGVAPIVPGFRSLAYKKLFKSCVKTLKKFEIKFSEFDVIHSHALFMGGYIALCISRKYKKPYFHTEHTSGLIFNPKQYSKQDAKIIKTVYNSANKVFFVSEFALDRTLNQYKIESDKKYKVISNVVEDSFFLSPLVVNSKEEFSYLMISNLISRKGVDLLLKSWCELINSYPYSKLTIAGEGPERNNLMALIEDLKLGNSVVFLPTLSRTDVKKQLISHHVLVSSSKIETFGLTVAEAQASGKPVVVTDSGGVRDIVTEETGIITNQNPVDFATGLISIQKNYSQYNPELIRNLAINKFSSKRISEELEKEYYSL